MLADGGSAAAWSPWLAVDRARSSSPRAVGLGFGAIAARSEGIYFLMITLAFSVLVYYFFSQVTELSGFGGVNNVDLPGLVGNPVQRPGAALLRDAGRRGARLPRRCATSRARRSGSALQGLRDEPARMRALGFDVTLHRMLAFGLAAFVAAFAGVLSVWYNRRISPGSINLGADDRRPDHRGHRRPLPARGRVGRRARLRAARQLLARVDAEVGNVLGPERFNTLIGLVFLVIVLLSPGGLVGLWEERRQRPPSADGGAPGPVATADRSGLSRGQKRCTDN